MTGRDNHIIASSLATALVALEGLAEDRQPKSDMEDLRAILRNALSPHNLSFYLAQAKCRLHPELDAAAVFQSYGIAAEHGDGAGATQ